MSEILYLLEMMNGAEGISDIEGKATRVGASERGQRASFKRCGTMGSDIRLREKTEKLKDGKAVRPMPRLFVIG